MPDFLRDVPIFDGNPSELMNWISDVEDVFLLYKDIPEDSVQYHLMERTIRRKVKGEASDVLNSNNVTCDWIQVKSNLLLYYSDKRDVKTLDYELTCIKKTQSETLSAQRA